MPVIEGIQVVRASNALGAGTGTLRRLLPLVSCKEQQILDPALTRPLTHTQSGGDEKPTINIFALQVAAIALIKADVCLLPPTNRIQISAHRVL